MGCENNNPNEVKKGIHFTLDERFVLEWLWNGKCKAKKERSPAKLAAILGKSRRTIIREMNLPALKSHMCGKLCGVAAALTANNGGKNGLPQTTDSRIIRFMTIVEVESCT